MLAAYIVAQGKLSCKGWFGVLSGKINTVYDLDEILEGA